MTEEISGMWQGYYAYDDERSDHQVSFTAHLISGEQGFEGTCKESGPHAHNEPAVMKGFTDEGLISYILKYPYYYGEDETGALFFDPAQPHPHILYTGTWNEEECLFRGVWEMSFGYFETEEGVFEDIHTGTWEMRKKS